MNHLSDVVDGFSQRSRELYRSQSRQVTFVGFLDQLEANPYALTRSAAAYLLDAMDYYGRVQVDTPMGKSERFKVFDAPFEDSSIPALINHEDVQQKFYRALKSFVQEGQINKLILLHGPNGSAKSSFFRCLIGGLEKYSHSSEGIVYTFNWIFPVETVYKKGIGLGAKSDDPDLVGDSYAHLDPEKISTIITNEMHDNPIFLLPRDLRKDLLTKLGRNIRDKAQKDRFENALDSLIEGSLSDKSNQIFEALLNSYKGDLKKVWMHVQVERFFFSKRFQSGAVTVDPQMNVDAHARQMTMNRSLAYIPPALQSLNLYSLDGPLINANRGIIEFNDLLKRPIEAFKYLLGTCETGIVNVGPSLAYLDQVMGGSCNEVQMEVFKDFPDFASFRARMEFIRVPYLLRFSQEKEIYNQAISGFAGGKHVSAYATEVLALWAVLTRLRKPQLSQGSAVVRRALEGLSALEKAKLYDHGEIPSRMSQEEAKELRAVLRDLYEEYDDSAGYEGRFGASAREMKMLLHHVAHLPNWTCVSGGKVIEELEDFVVRKGEYEFLRQEPSGGYHAHRDFVEVVRDHLLNLVDRDFKEAMGLAAEQQYTQILERYANHVKAYLRQEKVKNEVTGAMADPDVHFMSKTETMLDINKDRDLFRRDLMTTIAAWAHDHPGRSLDYTEIFPDFVKRIKGHFHEEQRKTVMKHLQAFLDLGNPDRPPDKTIDKKILEKAHDLRGHLMKSGRYCDTCAFESASLLLKIKYA